jgi:hypothetical protein
VSTSSGDPVPAKVPPTSMLSVLRSIVAEHPAAAAGLMVGAFAAGLAESTILALVAHAATAGPSRSTPGCPCCSASPRAWP